MTTAFLAPMLAGQELAAPADVSAHLRRVRGNRMAKAALETACWDLAARQAGVPLWQQLGGVRREIACGVSIGIQDTPAALLEKIETELAAGYQRIKIKIKPGWDVGVVERVRARLPDIQSDGRCQLGLHARRRAALSSARPASG